MASRWPSSTRRQLPPTADPSICRTSGVRQCTNCGVLSAASSTDDPGHITVLCPNCDQLVPHLHYTLTPASHSVLPPEDQAVLAAATEATQAEIAALKERLAAVDAPSAAGPALSRADRERQQQLTQWAQSLDQREAALRSIEAKTQAAKPDAEKGALTTTSTRSPNGTSRAGGPRRRGEAQDNTPFVLAIGAVRSLPLHALSTATFTSLSGKRPDALAELMADVRQLSQQFRSLLRSLRSKGATTLVSLPQPPSQHANMPSRQQGLNAAGGNTRKPATRSAVSSNPTKDGVVSMPRIGGGGASATAGGAVVSGSIGVGEDGKGAYVSVFVEGGTAPVNVDALLCEAEAHEARLSDEALFIAQLRSSCPFLLAMAGNGIVGATVEGGGNSKAKAIKGPAPSVAAESTSTAVATTPRDMLLMMGAWWQRWSHRCDQREMSVRSVYVAVCSCM